MCMGGGGSAPAPPPPTPAPQPIDTTKIDSQESSKKAEQDEKNRKALAKGQSSTINTSPLGDQQVATTQKTSMLGGGVQV